MATEGKDLDGLLERYDAKLDWRPAEGLWCLHGVNRDGNAWETDDYEADSESAALEAAAEYLRAYHDNRA
jgi:hypothetical protein